MLNGNALMIRRGTARSRRESLDQGVVDRWMKPGMLHAGPYQSLLHGQPSTSSASASRPSTKHTLNRFSSSSSSSSIVFDLYSASCNASNALITHMRRNEFSETIWSCRYTEQGPGVSVEASSIPSDPRRRKPDDHSCCDGAVEPSTGDGWPI